MRCIHCQSPLFPLNPKLKHKHQSISETTAKLLWVSKYYRIISIDPPGKQRVSSMVKKAIPDSLFLAATSPPNSGDISVVLQTGGLLLFVYFISNFLVPELITKSNQSEEASEDQKRGDSTSMEEDMETNTSAGSQTRSLKKKRGFNSSNR